MDLLLQKIAEKQESDRLAAKSEWENIVSKVTSGTATEKEIVAALKSSGKTLDVLAKAVAHERRIGELRDIVATLADARRAADETATAEIDFNVASQAEFIRTRDRGIAVRMAAHHSRLTLDNVQAAQRELDSLIGKANLPSLANC